MRKEKPGARKKTTEILGDPDIKDAELLARVGIEDEAKEEE